LPGECGCGKEDTDQVASGARDLICFALVVCSVARLLYVLPVSTILVFADTRAYPVACACSCDTLERNRRP
jgi:hypothetical protein